LRSRVVNVRGKQIKAAAAAVARPPMEEIKEYVNQTNPKFITSIDLLLSIPVKLSSLLRQ